MAPQLLATFNPNAAEMLYQAWANIQAPSSQTEVDAIRVKAGLFPGTYPGKPKVEKTGSTSFATPIISNSWGALLGSARSPQPPLAVPLDGVYDKILLGSWVAIERPIVDSQSNPTGGGRITFTYHQSWPRGFSP